MKRLNAHLIIDDSTEYRMSSALRIENSRSAMLYEPQIEITIPNRQPMRLSGNLMYRGLKRSAVELNVENVFSEPIFFSG